MPIFPPLQSAADFDEAACAALVRAALGDPVADVSIAGVRTWTMSAQVAERFQVRAWSASADRFNALVVAHDGDLSEWERKMWGTWQAHGSAVPCDRRGGLCCSGRFACLHQVISATAMASDAGLEP